MEVLIVVLLVICVGLGAYIARQVHRMTNEDALPSAKVMEALQERVSRTLSSLTAEEWKQVAEGDASILVAKSTYTRHDAAIRDGLIKQLKEVEVNLAKVTREYASNSGSGYAGLAAISKTGMKHLEDKAAQLRREIKDLG